VSSNRFLAKTGSIFALALLANCAVVSLAYSTESARGFLGLPLAGVQQQAFFKTFHLTEFVRRQTSFGATVVVFKPAQTRVHFEMAATIDKHQYVLAVQLWLRRSLIDGAETGAMAREVVQRFLREAPPSQEVQRLTDLTNEIQHRDSARGSAGGTEEPKATSKPSAGYLAFSGKQSAYQQALGTSLFQILNYRDRYGQIMILQLVPIGKGKHERALIRWRVYSYIGTEINGNFYGIP